MRKLLLAAVFMLFTLGLTAQNREIKFEESKVLSEIFDKAKSQNKLVFIDCYTDWCGPCKTLAKNVFTQDAVGDYFNENFINAKFEMEKDEDGVANKVKWGIRAFPTLIFVDPSTGEVVHRLVGAGKAEWLIEGAKLAKDPKNNLSGLIKRYEGGEREPQFLEGLLKALASGYMADMQAKVVTEYLDALSVDELSTSENWVMLRNNLNDPLAKPMRVVLANRQKFYDSVGEDVVNQHLEQSIMSAMFPLAAWRPERGNEFDQQRNDELIKYLKTTDFPANAQALAFLESAELVRANKWDALVSKMKQVEKDGIFAGKGNTGYRYSQLFIESLKSSQNKAIIEEGIKMIDKQIEEAGENSFRKADLSQSKVRLYESIGDELNADKSKMDEERYNKEGEAASSGRVTRSARMN